jgi:hypothetical protein
MNTFLVIALALPFLGMALLIWPCLLLAAAADADMPHPSERD